MNKGHNIVDCKFGLSKFLNIYYYSDSILRCYFLFSFFIREDNIMIKIVITILL